MKLYSYQKELVNSKSKTILANWCRGAGIDTALALYIIENKPKSTYLIGGKFKYDDLIKEMSKIQSVNGFVIEPRFKDEYRIIFNNIGNEISLKFIEDDDKHFDKKRHVDLIIDRDYFEVTKDNYNFNTYIRSTTKNIHEIKQETLNKYDEKIIVDHRKLLYENINNLDMVMNSTLNSKYFYSEFAILDKSPDDTMSFTTFKDKALQSLQKQFLEISNTKDTVLTRKTIIDMIRELDHMGRK